MSIYVSIWTGTPGAHNISLSLFHTHTHTHTNTRARAHTRTDRQTHTHTRTHAHAQTHTHTHARTHAHKVTAALMTRISIEVAPKLCNTLCIIHDTGTQTSDSEFLHDT